MIVKALRLGEFSKTSSRALLLVLLPFFVIDSPVASAKGPSLNVIELYDGASGPAYVQLTDVLINGKTELRSCASAESGPLDKSAYNKLPKLAMGSGAILDRDSAGVLRYRSSESAPPICVVPENIKFEHNAAFTAAALADQAEFRARALVDGSPDSPQPLKKGVKLVFVLAADTERAEYLLADRTANQEGWQKYLAKYSAAPHTDIARKNLASLCFDAGEAALKSYQASATGTSPSYADLKKALALQTKVHSLLANSEGDLKLADEIKKSLQALIDKGQSELTAYRAALATPGPGYAHLTVANSYAAAVADVSPTFSPLAKLQTDLVKESNTFNAALRTAQEAIDKKVWDEALKDVQPYRQFAGEEPRIAAILNGAYDGYFVQAQELDATKDWQAAIAAYRNALKAKDTAEARTAVENAEKASAAAQDQSAVQAALEKSKGYEQQQNMIPAYEVLASLPTRQQGMVKEDLTRLTPLYITAASNKAKDIAQLYDTIKGMGDEKAVETAYQYLGNAYDLSTDETAKQGFQVRIQNLSDELAAWFLDRAKHSLSRPLGSGTEIGWSYLKEAEFYKAANLEAVRDQMKIADAAHQMHSKLSIRVQFRDQTSQRQSGGFASQMESAIAAGLDSSGMPVKIIRSGDTTRPDVDPDFLIAGDVLEHNISLPPTVESIESNFIAGTHDVPNEAFTKLSRQYESATDALHTAQAALQGAQTKGNKKAVNEAASNVAVAQKKVDDLRAQLDATVKTNTIDVIRPYTYKKTTYNVLNRVVLQFRIDDNFGNQRGEQIQVTKEERKPFVVLSDVSAVDTNHIKNDGTIPDKDEMQNALENVAREELLQKIRDKVTDLPRVIYEDGQRKEHDGYNDDAAEAYMRYLNVAPADQREERDHAEQFLREQLNFQTFPNEIRPTSRPSPPLEQGMTRPATASR